MKRATSKRPHFCHLYSKATYVNAVTMKASVTNLVVIKICKSAHKKRRHVLTASEEAPQEKNGIT